MIKKTGNKWGTEKCGHCGQPHYRCSGRFTARNIEYVICGRTHKRVYLADCATHSDLYGVWKKEQKYADYVQDQFSVLTEHDHRLFEDVVTGLQAGGWKLDGCSQTSAHLSKGDAAIKVFRNVDRAEMIQVRFTAPPEENKDDV